MSQQLLLDLSNAPTRSKSQALKHAEPNRSEKDRRDRRNELRRQRSKNQLREKVAVGKNFLAGSELLTTAMPTTSQMADDGNMGNIFLGASIPNRSIHGTSHHFEDLRAEQSAVSRGSMILQLFNAETFTLQTARASICCLLFDGENAQESRIILYKIIFPGSELDPRDLQPSALMIPPQYVYFEICSIRREGYIDLQDIKPAVGQEHSLDFAPAVQEMAKSILRLPGLHAWIGYLNHGVCPLTMCPNQEWFCSTRVRGISPLPSLSSSAKSSLSIQLAGDIWVDFGWSLYYELHYDWSMHFKCGFRYAWSIDFDCSLDDAKTPLSARHRADAKVTHDFPQSSTHFIDGEMIDKNRLPYRKLNPRCPSSDLSFSSWIHSVTTEGSIKSEKLRKGAISN